jgi:hypothetical protein
MAKTSGGIRSVASRKNETALQFYMRRTADLNSTLRKAESQGKTIVKFNWGDGTTHTFYRGIAGRWTRDRREYEYLQKRRYKKQV